ncbi:heat shock protein GrpE [Anaerohalosphaera lusitana]|uniref:Heat shock protein GrpE n=1 Tax=Anaerohalosphaera lusitana TaxID=1936003 RepID=A0A1U9NMG9_9BACT|nr:nucleotide exchange factor GrpE [Anaerohalosphaera lusitana]AQT68706.1 heat shock protein GrpE [Anaerohalosphaera lusitana]
MRINKLLKQFLESATEEDVLKLAVRLDSEDKGDDFSQKIKPIESKLAQLDHKLSLLEANDKVLAQEMAQIRRLIEEYIVESSLKPLFVQVASLTMNLLKVNEGLVETDAESARRISVYLETFLEKLEKRVHLDLIIPEQGSEFDQDLHVAVAAVDTDRQDLHRKIAEVYKAGLIYKDKKLRPAEAAVFRYNSSDV